MLISASCYAQAETALAPIGWQIAQHEGRITKNNESLPIPTPEIIKDYFNETIKIMAPLPDDPQRDYWDEIAKPYGDCEDFALVIRRKLLENGYFGGRLAVSQRPEGRHAVLVFGSLVVDNNGISDISEHKFLKIEVNNKWYKV